MLELGREEVIRRFNIHRENFIKQTLIPNIFTKRQSIKYAIILLAGELANECLGLDLDLNYIMGLLLENEQKTSGGKDLGRAYHYLLQQYSMNIKKFSSLEIGTIDPNGRKRRQEFINASGTETWGVIFYILKVTIIFCYFLRMMLTSCAQQCSNHW